MYRFSSWINKDKTKNLLIPLYGYLSLIIASSFFRLPTINLLSLYYAPIACTLFFMIHQHTLQKNIITGEKTYSQPLDTLASTWIETLIHTCLNGFNTSKDLFLIIEKHNDISDYITSHDPVNAPLSKSLVSLLLESKRFDQTKAIWIQSRGTIVALNADIYLPFEPLIDYSCAQLPLWKQQALCLSKATDLIALKASHASRSFDVIVEGKLYEELNTHSVMALLDYYTKHETTKDVMERYPHDMEHKKSQQQSPS